MDKRVDLTRRRHVDLARVSSAVCRPCHGCRPGDGCRPGHGR
ncbi:putative leader peptide [Streptomyces sp. NPDC002690]